MISWRDSHLTNFCTILVINSGKNHSMAPTVWLGASDNCTCKLPLAGYCVTSRHSSLVCYKASWAPWHIVLVHSSCAKCVDFVSLFFCLRTHIKFCWEKLHLKLLFVQHHLHRMKLVENNKLLSINTKWEICNTMMYDVTTLVKSVF